MSSKRCIGHSTAEFATYSTTAPTSSDTYTALTSDVVIKAVIPSNRMLIYNVEVFLDADGLVPPEAAETSVTVTLTRGSAGEYVIFSQAVAPVLVSGSQYAAGSHQFDPPIPYINFGLTAGELTYDPATTDGQALYCFIHGAAGSHAARVVVYWERLEN